MTYCDDCQLECGEVAGCSSCQVAICHTCIRDHQCRCGLCGQPGADKIPHPVRWPGEAMPDRPMVHAECEHEECGRAHAELNDEQRRRFLSHL